MLHNLPLGGFFMLFTETGDRFYPQLRGVEYTQGSSVYGEPDRGIEAYLQGIWGQKVLDPTVGDGKYLPTLLTQENIVVGGDLNETVDRNDVRPLDALAAKFPGQVRRQLYLLELNAFDAFPFRDGLFDCAVNTGFLYLFPPELVKRNVDETARVLDENGLLIFDFATGIQRIYPDGAPVYRAGSVDYSLTEGMALVRMLLQDSFEPPQISISHIDQVLPNAGYTMKNTKLNVRAKKRT